jgi:hypothetical protein
MSGMAQIHVSLTTWKAIEAQRLSFDEDHDSIIRRALSARTNARKHAAREVLRADIPVQRRRGDMSIYVNDREIQVANLKGAYIEILSQLVKIRPSLFQMLLKEGSDRRRWIALSPAELFPLSPHLIRQHAYQIAPNWFIDTNLSKSQIETRCERICALAGFAFGAEVRIAGG